MSLPFTGGDVVPGKVLAPLIDNAPGPVQVSGFVPVVLDRSPEGVAGETLSSDRAGRRDVPVSA